MILAYNQRKSSTALRDELSCSGMSDVFDRYEVKLTISSIYVILGYVQLEIMALKGGLFIV
jgi:hypothetical protein